MQKDKIKTNNRGNIALCNALGLCCLTGLLIPGKAFRGRKETLTLEEHLDTTELYIIVNNSSHQGNDWYKRGLQTAKAPSISPSPRLRQLGGETSHLASRCHHPLVPLPPFPSPSFPHLPAPSWCIQQPREIKRCSLMSPSLQTDLTFLNSLDQRNKRPYTLWY